MQKGNLTLLQNVILSTIAIPDLIDRIAGEVEFRLSTKNHPTTAIPKKPIKGIHALAEFIGVSPPRAQKLKNEGVFPFFQDGRLVLFDPDKVLEAMANYNHKSRRVR